MISQHSVAYTITVNVNNIDVSKGGNIIVFLFSEAGFPKKHHHAVTKSTQRVTNQRQQLTLTHQQESFAIKVLHDENGDGKVTKNWTGIYPHDGLVFSNQQTLSLLGPPSYQKCQLQSEENQTIHLSIKYP